MTPMQRHRLNAFMESRDRAERRERMVKIALITIGLIGAVALLCLPFTER